MTVPVRSVTGVVTGRVQGVAFRASMAAEARRLGLAGWVRNRRDGRVEFRIAGVDEDVEALLAWARRGPPLARVDALTVEPCEAGARAPEPFTVLGDA